MLVEKFELITSLILQPMHLSPKSRITPCMENNPLIMDLLDLILARTLCLDVQIQLSVVVKYHHDFSDYEPNFRSEIYILRGPLSNFKLFLRF